MQGRTKNIPAQGCTQK